MAPGIISEIICAINLSLFHLERPSDPAPISSGKIEQVLMQHHRDTAPEANEIFNLGFSVKKAGGILILFLQGAQKVFPP